ncbi:MAG TPA: DUF364 domain-containing protein [Candidatus Acidoferrum sp.]|nr:DUF364 domain-containing protein [Candidatus Acidoferrum sp.]
MRTNDAIWQLYDALLEGIPEGKTIEYTAVSELWSLVGTADSVGVAMTTSGDTRPPILTEGFTGSDLKRAAAALKSWNFDEAGYGGAAVNAHYNTKTRLRRLACGEPYKNYCTRGLDLEGKTVGMVGHLKTPPELFAGTREVFILERNPQAGDYPDPACEYLLPMCDIAIITGSALVNKTLPRLLDLCRGAYVILTGPSVPMCPALLEFGIDRLAGLVLTDFAGAVRHVRDNVLGPPFTYGQTFLIGRDLP